MFVSQKCLLYVVVSPSNRGEVLLLYKLLRQGCGFIIWLAVAIAKQGLFLFVVNRKLRQLLLKNLMKMRMILILMMMILKVNFLVLVFFCLFVSESN